MINGRITIVQVVIDHSIDIAFSHYVKRKRVCVCVRARARVLCYVVCVRACVYARARARVLSYVFECVCVRALCCVCDFKQYAFSVFSLVYLMSSFPSLIDIKSLVLFFI